MSQGLKGCPYPAMVSCQPHPGTETQEVQCVLLVTLLDSHQRLQDIMHTHFNRMWQLVTMASTFMLMIQWLVILHRAIYHTLRPPNVMDSANIMWLIRTRPSRAPQSLGCCGTNSRPLSSSSRPIPPALTGGSRSSWEPGTINSGSRPSAYAT
ncbi:hypothetical protein Y1Q_0019505 [Alligator mississippiensis]|uniref:Uncharacterized protein n=1 Tax=Alligator mississippiensis TaxID=8496 RepID=A0A151NMJ1_ALLMI|nr:hypothetical protein Y1Q_0019505 [Alligator mississippiensis]